MKRPLGSAFALAVSLAAFMAAPGAQAVTLSLNTEDLPPRNFVKDGKVVGAATDQVNELMKRAGVDFKIEVMAWTRAITLAETEENTCVFSTLHTEARDPKFKWVEPLVVEPIVLAKKKGGTVAPANLEAAKDLMIGTQTKSAPLDVATKLGFKRIETTQSYEQSLQKVAADRVDLGMITRSALKGFIAKGVEVEELMVVQNMSISLACSKNTPDDVIAKLNTTLEAMIKDGTQAKILAEYGM